MKPKSLLDKLIWLSLKNRLVVFLGVLIVLGWGVASSPFQFKSSFLPRNPVNVDAIPNIGENQQIVFTRWEGRSPSDIEDQITYPLSQLFLGIPGVKTVRGSSMFGFSSIYVIFKDDIEFYWSRTRLLEYLNSIPPGYLPNGVKPTMGPPATALGQVYWYNLEGLDKDGNPTGGWDLNELRTIQDYFIKYALMSVDGVAEVASIGGYVTEYQVEVDPNLMRQYHINIMDVAKTIKASNDDVGARTMEINGVEYIIRGVGRLKDLGQLQDSVIKTVNNTPLRIRDVANVFEGPAMRRGVLDKGGAEVVGGVIAVREGANSLEVIKQIKERIEKMKTGMPQKVLSDGRVSKLHIVSFYDRTKLIHETIDTLKVALRDEILITIIVILIMLGHFKSTLIIGSMLPMAVLFTFVIMKSVNLDANILSLSGIAIAIGTMVDMGIVICENIVRHLDLPTRPKDDMKTIYLATKEVASAIITSVATTLVSFIPVFAMKATEGKLFKPLAFTKTFALMSSLILAILVIPSIALFMLKNRGKLVNHAISGLSLVLAITAGISLGWEIGLFIFLVGIYKITGKFIPERAKPVIRWSANIILAVYAIWLLGVHWMVVGEAAGDMTNFLMTATLISSILAILLLFRFHYEKILSWSIKHKIQFISAMVFIMFFGLFAFKGAKSMSGLLPGIIKNSDAMSKLRMHFPGMQKEFMPPLDEGSFLYMPTVMPGASLATAKEVLRLMDMGIMSIPEVENSVGKLGRAETPLDPAPISMFETIISYKSKYLRSDSNELLKFKYDGSEIDFMRSVDGKKLLAGDGKPYKIKGKFERDRSGKLIPDSNGKAFRIWRKPLDVSLNPGRKIWSGINTPTDIWMQITMAAKVPGATSAPKLQPIATRIVMLQSGIRAEMAVKLYGNSQKDVQSTGDKIEAIIRKVPSVVSDSVSAEKSASKAYLEVTPKVVQASRYGLGGGELLRRFAMAVGGKKSTTIIRGRERIPVRVRYMRDFRNSPKRLENLLIPTGINSHVPLKNIANIRYKKGSQVIKSENSFKTSSVTFEGKKGFSKVKVMEDVLNAIKTAQKNNTLKFPAGVTLKSAGSYENHVRAAKTLQIIIPVALLIIFIIIYLQFHSVIVTMILFSSIAIAWSGGFIMIWLYSQDWFMNFTLMGSNMRELLNMHPMNMSVAVWVGFLALFGIATDDGVVIMTYLTQKFAKQKADSIEEIRNLTISAGKIRVRACLMTTATTILALLPVLTSRGRGSDVMGPMAVPIFGGMLLEVFTMLVVPVLFSLYKETSLKLKSLEKTDLTKFFKTLKTK